MRLLSLILISSVVGLVLSPFAMPSSPDGQAVVRQHFPALARTQGFVCDAVSTITYHGQTERGGLFRIQCNADRLAYRVTMTPQNILLIKPWSE